MDTEDPLTELLVDRRQLDRARITEVLRQRLALDEATSEPVLRPGYHELSGSQKVLALLLLRKASVLLDRTEDEALSPSDLAEQGGLPGGTVRRVLHEHRNSRLVTQNFDGRYYLSNAQVGRAIKLLEDHTTNRASRRPRRAAPRSRAKDAHGGSQHVRNQRGVVGTNDRSPTALVRKLAAAGFYASPRTLAEVQQQLRDKTGHHVPITTLSSVHTRLLRTGALDRHRSGDGKYAYFTSNTPASKTV